MVEVSFGGAKDFKTLVSEQKANNKGQEGLKKVLENISKTQDKIAQAQGIELQEEKKTDAKETEDKRGQNRIFKTIQKGIFGVGKEIGGVYKFLEKSALDSAKKAGTGILNIAKKFLFGGALLSILAFMDSEDWEKIKKTAENILIKLKELALSPFWTNMKNLLTDFSWENLSKLFEDNFAAATTLATIIGGYAIFKLFTPFRAVGIGITKLIGAFSKDSAFRKGLDKQTNRLKNTRVFRGLGRGIGGLLSGIGAIGSQLTDMVTGTEIDDKGKVRDKKLKTFAPKASRGALGITKGLAKLVPGLGLAVTGIFGVIDGVTAGMEEAKKEGATKTSILREGIAGTLSGLTFGFVGQDQISSGLTSLGNGIKNAFTPSEEFKKKVSETFNRENIISGMKSLNTRIKETFTPSDEFKERMGKIFNRENIITNMKSLNTKIKETFTPSDEFKERIGKIFDRENIVSSLKSIGNKAKESFGLSEEFIGKIAGVKDTFTTGLTNTFKGVGNFFNNKFKFDSKEETIASAINAVTLPANIVKDSILGAGAFLATRLGFDDASEDIQNLNQKSIGELVTDSFNSIFGFFKDLLNIDVKGLARSLIPDKLEPFLGLGPEENKNTQDLEREIQEAQDRIARSESGENVYGSSFGNAFGLESIGIRDDKKEIENLTLELKKLQEEIADSKRTGTGGDTIINNNNVVGGGGSGGSGSGPAVPYPVRDVSIPNKTYF